ncbi:MAG: hypothetical protein AB1801_11940 [Chloroflexota bacterium]
MDSHMTQAFAKLLTKMRHSPNHISPSAYDTAWLAWLFPEAKDWIINTQHPDGSWGAEIEYYHDRVIATLAAVNAIAATSENSHELKQVERGIQYLEKAIPRLPDDVYETVGFELLLPSLVEIGQNLGLKYERIVQLIQPELPKYHQKLALIPPAMLYSRRTTIPYSLEFIGFNNLDHAAIANLRAPNGGIHSSPSATAFVEVATNGSAGGQRYLRHILDSYNNTAPTLVPFETFEIVWSLYHIGLQQDLAALTPEILPLITTLENAWTDEGVGLSKGFVVDADDTALGFFILTQFNIVPNPRIFEHYEVEDHFRCFSFERNISLDIHVHIVDTLKAMPDFPRRDEMLLKALNTLGRYLTDDYIVDKWHISPYYSTSHAIIGLTGLSDNIIQKQIKWLLNTQQANGSWTFYPHFPQAALEETAYVLMALMTVYEKKGNIPFEVIERGFRYMEQNYRPAEKLPSLWISKVLYNPYHIVEAVLQSTMLKYQTLKKDAVLMPVA